MKIYHTPKIETLRLTSREGNGPECSEVLTGFFWLSHTHDNTHTHNTHTQSVSHLTHTPHTYRHTHSQSHTTPHTHTETHRDTVSLTHTHTHTQRQSLTHTHTHKTQSHTHTHWALCLSEGSGPLQLPSCNAPPSTQISRSAGGTQIRAPCPRGRASQRLLRLTLTSRHIR